ncbi:MAG: ATPase, T2SS/T4P/T4SS family [Dialister sp.]|nr:ATPase, T2SS/T4P/T4SS family [Dialister sp.]
MIQILEAIVEKFPRLTDIHITEGAPILIRESGALLSSDFMAETGLFSELAKQYILPERMKELAKKGGCDASFTLQGLRCRMHIYRAGGKQAAAIRILPTLANVPPDLDDEWLTGLSSLMTGLVLIAGPSGSGKSTTMARILQKINALRPCHIITLEDPVEYILPSDRALIHQREIGNDVESFPEGVRASLREDPDVIAIGEMRDLETISAALTAAETGHLVLGTIHTGTAAGGIRRLIHAFPESGQSEARYTLSSVLRSISAQKLYQGSSGTVLLREILTNTPAISHLIREGKEEQIPSYMETAAKDMRTMKHQVYELLQEGAVPTEERTSLLHFISL